jgi:archaellum component FlaC
VNGGLAVSEQDEIQHIGRLSKEVGGLKKRSALIAAELEQVVKALAALVDDLRPRANPFGYQRSSHRPIILQEYASKYSDLSKLIELTMEQDAIERQLSEAKEKLAELGAA